MDIETHTQEIPWGICGVVCGLGSLHLAGYKKTELMCTPVRFNILPFLFGGRRLGIER